MLCSMCQHGTTQHRDCAVCGERTCMHVKCCCKEFPWSTLADALTDLLDGQCAPEEIHRQTGLPVSRCEEIYRMFNILMRRI
jgi:hypothetical protein